jgi:WD40 repeat protein
MSPSPRIFVSYERQDGMASAQALRKRLEERGFTLWQDLIALEGGLEWWTQIEQAIKSPSIEHLVLVVTPGALERPIIKKELRLARQEGRQVSPVWAGRQFEMRGLPRWFERVHIYNIEYPEQWERLVQALSGPSRQNRVPFMAPDPPKNFVERPGELAALKAQLLDDKGDAVATTVALRGAGGFGKSALANYLCHDPEIQEAYVDGILHVEIGEQPNDLLARVADLILSLTGERSGLQTVGAASAKLADALAERRCLLVIDDVWREQDLRPFLQGGRNTTRLITTRLDHVLPADTFRVVVDAMRTGEALTLLTQGLPPDQVQTEHLALRTLAARLGEWPLLLTLAGGFLRDRVIRAREPLAQAIASVNRRLDARGLTAFDAKNEAARHKAVDSTLSVSLELLNEDEQARLRELAVFPEDTDVPLGICTRLWEKTGGLDELDSEDLLQRFLGYSLLLDLNLQFKTFRLHDVVRQYLLDAWKRAQQADSLRALHEQLVAAVGKPDGSDLAASSERRYWYEHAAHHLAGADRTDAVAKLLLDPEWMLNKLTTTSPESLLTDYRRYAKNRAQELVGRVLDLASRILARDPKQLPVQLLARLAPEDAEGLGPFLAAASSCLPSPALVPTRPTFTAPGAEIRRFDGHQDGVSALAVLDGRRFLSCSYDATIRMWDAETGAELRRFEGHEGPVLSLVRLDGTRVASGSKDKTLRIWNVETGQELRRIVGHDGAVTRLTLLDGRIISASEDNTIRFWDAETGDELRQFVADNVAQHERGSEWLTAIAGLERGATSIAVDQRQLIAGFSDKSLRLWDLEKPKDPPQVIDGKDSRAPVMSLAILDGRRFLSGGSDYGVLRLWDRETAHELRKFEGVRFWALSLATLDNHRVAVATAGYCEVEIWDIESGEKLRNFSGHSSSATSVAVLDRSHVLSSSHDRTVRLWSLEESEKLTRYKGLDWWVSSFLVLDDRRVLTGAWWGALTLWDIATGEELRAFKGQHKGWVTELTRLDDLRVVSCGQNDNTLRVWDLEAGTELRCLEGHGEGVSSVATLDARRVISASWDKTLRIWDVETGAELRRFEGHDKGVNSVAVLDVRRVISASSDMTLRLWDVETGAELRRLEGHDKDVHCVTVLDVRHALSGSEDGTLRLWDVETGAELRRFDGHRGGVYSIAVFDERHIVSASRDRTVRLWNVESGQEVALFEGDVEFTDIAVMPDKRTIAVRDAVARLHWLDVRWAAAETDLSPSS